MLDHLNSGMPYSYCPSVPMLVLQPRIACFFPRAREMSCHRLNKFRITLRSGLLATAPHWFYFLLAMTTGRLVSRSSIILLRPNCNRFMKWKDDINLVKKLEEKGFSGIYRPRERQISLSLHYLFSSPSTWTDATWTWTLISLEVDSYRTVCGLWIIIAWIEVRSTILRDGKINRSGSVFSVCLPSYPCIHIIISSTGGGLLSLIIWRCDCEASLSYYSHALRCMCVSSNGAPVWVNLLTAN